LRIVFAAWSAGWELRRVIGDAILPPLVSEASDFDEILAVLADLEQRINKNISRDSASSE
jgi:hypothetical protein